ncbi:MAG TPA: CoA transferase [Dehalococcoidia bacterium]|nr:CoA transferase [Dehalococcoidia bacterium]
MKNPSGHGDGLLTACRVLDLSNERGFLCGKILGDFGADVIKVEPPGGDAARSIGPFYKDFEHPEKSLYWFALNTSKRGITLDIETKHGQETFKQLVRGADLVVESFPPEYMDSLGLGYSSLEAANPGIVMTSVTPFGSTGPYAHYKGTDMVISAMSGFTYMCGEPSGPPYRISVPQSYLHAGLHAAMGSMIALYHREATGKGQHVDVSIQEASIFVTEYAMPSWDLNRVNPQRSGLGLTISRPTPPGPLWMRWIYPCKDGYVNIFLSGGAQAGLVNSSEALVEMANSEGMALQLKDYDWATHDASQISQEERDTIENAIIAFLRTKTKQELYHAALEKGMVLAPLNTIKDVVESPQLAARQYFVEVEHPELDDIITYPGAPVKLSEVPWQISRRAPLIGEHNKEIYEGELNLTGKESIGPRADEMSSALADCQPKARYMEKKQVLEGVKVADFAWVAAGPQIGRTLAEHGATVVRIESHRRPDLLRLVGPFKDFEPGINRSGYFTMVNTNKYGISIDVSRPRGKEVVKKLIGWADVVVENFSQGTMKKLGLGYEEVKMVKPDVIYASTCMQGQYGPHASFQGYGDQLAALSGFPELVGRPDGEPSMPPWAYTDFVAPWYVVAAIIGALIRRDKMGKGMYIEQAQYEAGATFLSPAILDYTVNGRVTRRMANRDPNAAPHGVYPCKGQDRWCAIAAFTEADWSAFCEVIGNPAWTEVSKFATLLGRKRNEDELDKLVGEWTINYTAEEVMTLMQAKGVPAGVVYTAEDAFNCPQMKHREHFVYLEHPVIGRHAYHNEASRFSKTPQDFYKAAPCLGEDNEYVYKEILGLSDDEIADLLVEGVITTEC